MSPSTSLTKDEILLLDNFIYSDDVFNYNNMPVCEFIDDIIAKARNTKSAPAMMSPDEWVNILKNIAKGSTLSSLKVEHGQDDGAAGGIHAACFVDPSGKAYAIFRGTSGPFE